MKSFTEYFTEAHGKNDDCFQKFGKQLFGDLFPNGEKNTPKESEIQDLLKLFLKDDLRGKDKQQVIKAFAELKSCSSHFPRQLISKNNTLVRGVTMTLDEVLSLKLVWEQTTTGLRSVGKYKPKSPVQSWTTNKSIASRFANDIDDETKLLPVIIESTIKKDDLLFNINFLRKVKGALGMKNEDEIIHISDKPIKVTINIARKLSFIEEFFPKNKVHKLKIK